MAGSNREGRKLEALVTMELVHEFHGLSNKYDVLVLGAMGVGKTSLILRYVQQQFLEHPEEIAEEGFYRKAIEVDRKYGTLSVQDTDSSKDIYSTSRQLLIQNSRSIVFVYSMTDHRSFEMVEDLVHRTKAVGHKVPFVLVGTKSDLADEQQVTFDEGEQLAQLLGAQRFFVCSSKTNEGINEIFGSLIPILSDQAARARSETSSSPGSQQRDIPCVDSDVLDQELTADFQAGQDSRDACTQERVRLLDQTSQPDRAIKKKEARQEGNAHHHVETKSERPKSLEKKTSVELGENQGMENLLSVNVEARRRTVETPALESASSKACCIIV